MSQLNLKNIEFSFIENISTHEKIFNEISDIIGNTLNNIHWQQAFCLLNSVNNKPINNVITFSKVLKSFNKFKDDIIPLEIININVINCKEKGLNGLINSQSKPIECFIDCSMILSDANVPIQIQLLSKCNNNAEATIIVRNIEPPLAFKSAGIKFDQFIDELTDQWRSHAMGLVKQGLSNKKLDENKRIKSNDMYHLISKLHTHLKSVELTKEFESSFKSLSL